MSVTAIIVGGGSSSRMNGTDKVMLEINGRTVFEMSIAAFCLHEDVDNVVVVARKDLVQRIEMLKEKYKKLYAVVPGGESRCLSVKEGIKACPDDTGYFAIHDAARPFVSAQLISDTISAAKQYGAAAPGIPMTDTVKVTGKDGKITATPDRDSLVRIQTPQVFLADRYRKAIEDFSEAYDDCQLYEKTGYPVYAVRGEEENFKITSPADLERIERRMTDYRVGHGYDVHKLVEDRKLILGGVEIPFEKGLLGHSDADVLLHALSDAILGAAGLRDIGVHFPDSDPAYEGADSRVLLRECVRLAAEKGYRISNADVTVICQRPKLSPYIEKMRDNIAEDLKVEPDRINVKATTEEKLGFTGEGLGISAHAVAMIVK